MAILKPLAGEKQSRESDAAVQACNDYLRMGPGRSLAKLHEKYTEGNQNEPPTESESTLKRWSTRYGWQERASLFDAQWEQRKNERRDIALRQDLANDFGRIDELVELAGFLKGQIYEQGVNGNYHNIWLPDVKVVGYGESAEVVEIERFNAPLIREYRGVLSDLADETGGRVKRQEITGAEGGPVKHEVNVRELSDDELQQLIED